MKIVSTVLRSSGPALFASLQLSTINTARKIIVTKSVGQLSPLPFTSLCTNCIVWTLYGAMKHDLTVFLPNASGILVGLWCAMIYQRFSNDSPYLLYAFSSVVVLAAVIFATMNRASLVGVLGCILSVLLSGSPLAVVKTVLKEKSTAALPFSTSAIMWLNSLCWLLYGILIADDLMIIGPNALGLFLSTLQMLLFLRFGFASKGNDDKSMV